MSDQRKPRGRARFRKGEITRAFCSVPGATSVEIFPADGRIVVHTAGPAERMAVRDALDAWITKRGKHAGPAEGY